MKSKVSFFLGANTPSGFHSLYHELIDRDTARRVFLLKGGAGCGKSSLMRRAAKAAEERGEPVEYIYCSGDPDSLDGVVFPRLHSAIVDATAPHVIEPKLPGVVDSYVDLGQFYDTAALAPLREEISAETAAYQAPYKRAYRCLTAACQLMEDDRALLASPTLEAKLAKRAKGIMAREFKKTGRQPGRCTHRFLGAVTCKGLLCSFDTVDTLCRRVYELEDSHALAAELLNTLAAGAMAAGYDVILCPSPLFPDRPEHLLIPELSLAFVTGTSSHPYPGRPHRRMRVDAMVDAETTRRYKARLKFSRKVIQALLGEAVDALAQAKAHHDRLEALYNPHVDFKGVYRAADAVIAALFPA